MKVELCQANLRDCFRPKFGEIQFVTVEKENPKPTGTLSITENGTYNVCEYAIASVSVPTPIPEGYLKPEGLFVIRENGAYDVSGYAQVSVSVSSEVIEDYAGAFTIT